MDILEQLLALPGTPQEEAWLRERLETLTASEGIVLTAALRREPPSNRADAINHLFSLTKYNAIPSVGNYRQLGEYYFNFCGLLEDALPYTDMEKLGCFFGSRYPGQFVRDCYVIYPEKPPAPVYDGSGAAIPEDGGWSVKLKLASPACPEGVWLRLPDYSEPGMVYSTEIELALYSLHVKSLEECTLLDAKCILPEAGNLMAQYDSVTELVRDGNNLGYVLDERGQGGAHWMEKFAAALEYEGCHSLRFALDISQNIKCYEWMSRGGLADFAANKLQEEDVPDELIQSGCIDLEGYAEDLLETSGYMLTNDESAYVTRNGREFIREFTEEQASPEEHGGETALQEQGEMTM